MAQVIAIFQAVVSLIPALIQAIKAIEDALPASGQGAKKLDLIRSMMESAFSQTQQAGLAFQQVWPPMQTAISGIVSLYNSIGEFKKS